jgi:hypothetical protein
VIFSIRRNGPPAIHPCENLFKAGDPNEYGTIIGYSGTWELDTCGVFQGPEPVINSEPLTACRLFPSWPSDVHRPPAKELSLIAQ